MAGLPSEVTTEDRTFQLSSRALTVALVPLPEAAAEIAGRIPFGAGSLAEAVADAASRFAGGEVRAGDFRDPRLPEHPVLRLLVVGEGGATLAEGRDLERLRSALGRTVRADRNSTRLNSSH